MEKDDVKSQVTTMMICSGRNGNHSLFNVIMDHNASCGNQSYVSYPDVSLSTTIGS